MTPPGDTQYGTPRTFQATVVNVATSNTAQSYSGNISFVDGGGRTLCTTTATNDPNLVGVVVRCFAGWSDSWSMCQTLYSFHTW